MNTASLQLETPPTQRGIALRACFAWHRDRYAHRIELLTPTATVPLLESREGGDSQAWPPSPPLQQSAAHAGPPAAILATGMAGPNHWSLVATADGPASLAFDVACRLLAGGESCSLGSAYRQLVAAEMSDDPRQIRLSIRGETVRFRAFEQGPLLRLSPAPHGQDLTLQVAVADVTLPATVRWQYRLQVLAVPRVRAG